MLMPLFLQHCVFANTRYSIVSWESSWCSPFIFRPLLNATVVEMTDPTPLAGACPFISISFNDSEQRTISGKHDLCKCKKIAVGLVTSFATYLQPGSVMCHEAEQEGKSTMVTARL